MKRRALLLGALLMPTAARAKTTKQATRKPAAASKPPPPPPSGPQPLKDAKTQLIAFNASPFPYRGNIPGSNKPFLDAKDGKRRGHTTQKGRRRLGLKLQNSLAGGCLITLLSRWRAGR